MKEATAVFNEKDDAYTITPPGVYPAHVIELRSRTLNNKGDERIVFNFKVRIASEAGKQDVPSVIKDETGGTEVVLQENGKALMVKADFMVSREFESRGVWFTPIPPKKEQWRNRDYKEFAENLGVEFPKDEKTGNIQLGELEESDVLGLPLQAKIGEYEYTNKKTGKTVKKIALLNAYKWPSGTRLKPDELIEAPF